MQGNATQKGIQLLNQLKTDQWPFPIEELPNETFLVGGAIRDLMLDRLKEKPDLDLIVPDNAIKLSNDLAKRWGGRSVILDKKRDIARLIINGWTFDLAKQEGLTLQEDLFRRDFRINAIALRIKPSPLLIDPTGGIKDLEEKILVGIKEDNFRDDPLRCLRGFRLIAEMNLELDTETHIWINNNHKLLIDTAPERIQSELVRLVSADSADQVVQTIKSNNILSLWQDNSSLLSEKMPSVDQAAGLTSKEKRIALPLARITYLINDEGLKRLRFSKRLLRRCELLRKWQNINHSNGLENISESERVLMHLELEQDLPALLLSFSKKKKLSWLKRWRDKDDPLFHPFSPLNGNELKKELNVASGALLGELMQHLCKEQAFGRLKNREDALKKASNWLALKATFL